MSARVPPLVTFNGLDIKSLGFTLWGRSERQLRRVFEKFLCIPSALNLSISLPRNAVSKAVAKSRYRILIDCNECFLCADKLGQKTTAVEEMLIFPWGTQIVAFESSAGKLGRFLQRKIKKHFRDNRAHWLARSLKFFGSFESNSWQSINHGWEW